MNRIILDRTVKKGEEVLIEGPPLEALLFQGGRRGGIVTVSDRRGIDFRGRVLQLSKERALILIFDCFPAPAESPLEIVLLQALPERERMELIIQKTTELGVSAIIPFKSERSISLEEREAKQRKAHRWQAIAIKAVQQSRRALVPKVEAYRPFQEALVYCSAQSLSSNTLIPIDRPNRVDNSSPVAAGFSLRKQRCSQPPDREETLRILLWEKDGGPLKDLLKRSHPQRIYAMVGPEGGFTEEEVKSAKEAGFVPVKLGQRILRTETAAIILIGILQYELGDLG